MPDLTPCSATLREDPPGTFTLVLAGTPCFVRDGGLTLASWAGLLRADAERRNLAKEDCQADDAVTHA